jgi:lipoprotein-anchoring transpeptidase ErfK/SrfK
MTFISAILHKTSQLFTIAIISTMVFGTNITASADFLRIPYDVCELSKSYPTLATEVKKGPLTQTALLVNCELVELFPSITAAGNYYTPIGQYTIDYTYMQRETYLNNPKEGTINLYTPFWMTYTKMKGDFGQYAGRNLYGVHGAPWRKHGEFTGEKEIYIGGSHGCTNIEDANAAIIFEYVSQYKKRGQQVKVVNYTR